MSGASLGGMSGDLLITGAFEGDLTIDNTGGALPTPGDITIGDDYAGTIRSKTPAVCPTSARFSSTATSAGKFASTPTKDPRARWPA